MAKTKFKTLPPYRESLAGVLLAAREAAMAPFRPMLRDAGVTEQQWRVLRVLDNQGPTDPTRLANLALLYSPSVARILRELADRKLIIRKQDPTDLRRAVISLSNSGRALIRETSRYTVRALNEYTERFGAERLERLIDELRAFTETIAPLAPQSEQKEGRPSSSVDSR